MIMHFHYGTAPLAPLLDDVEVASFTTFNGYYHDRGPSYPIELNHYES